jgi:uncharacterized linocin/CFP29 family protein
MNHLLREVAPVTERAWAEIDGEAVERLTPALGARRLVDFAGPHGWEHSATSLGRTVALDGSPAPGVTARQRRVLPLVELRADFRVARTELADISRGAVDVDLDELDEAARQIALAENAAVFHGFAAAGVVGIAEVAPNGGLPLGADAASYPEAVARAVERIRLAGVGGPYGIALAPDVYTKVVETTEHGGYPVFDHLRRILDGPIVWAPGVQGAVVVSMRGGDFLFESGEDLAIGYERADETHVHLYLEESFSFRVATPEAAVALPA